MATESRVFVLCALSLAYLVWHGTSSVAHAESVNDVFGEPRAISQAPPVGVHPRVLFTEAEFDALIDRYATGQDGSWEAYFRRFTASIHGPSNEALTLLYSKDLSNMGDSDLAELAEGAGWGTKSNGHVAKMEEPTAAAMYMIAFQAFLQTRMDPEGTDSPLFEKLTVVMDKWSKIIVAHADKYQCVESAVETETPCVNRAGDDYRMYLWQRDWNLDHEWRSG